MHSACFEAPATLLFGFSACGGFVSARSYSRLFRNAVYSAIVGQAMADSLTHVKIGYILTECKEKYSEEIYVLSIIL